MGHDGMLYSLPSRDLIADSVEYMVNAHCADAMVCISNCDKITPGMLMASMRLNIPVVFVSGGPMEAGKAVIKGKEIALDLVDAMVVAADESYTDAEVEEIEKASCPTCGSCSGMFTANSMNCLTEALGLSLPGNGSTLATHADRKRLFVEAGHLIVDLAKRYYEQNDESILPRNVANKQAFENAMALDIAMGGSTNTILHILAAVAQGALPVQGRACQAGRAYGGCPPRGRDHGDPWPAGQCGAVAPRLRDRPFAQHGCCAGSLGYQPDEPRERAAVLQGGPRQRAFGHGVQSGEAVQGA